MNASEQLPLGYLLNRIVNRLRTDVSANVLEALGLSFPQYVCLRILEKLPGMSNADMAREIGVSPQAMNIVVRALQDRGLIARPSTVASGRSRPTELTPAGRTLVAQTVPGVCAAEDRLFEPLSLAERAEFHRMMTLLADVTG